MAQAGTTAGEHALAEAMLSLTGLEVTLATLRDNGIIENAQLVEIVRRLGGVIDSFASDSSAGRDGLAATMRVRLAEMSTYLGVDLRQN